MNRLTIGGAVAAIAVCVMVAGQPAAQADKHDSNTLHKLGNAIQYPVRKSTENMSVAMHRGENRKSVESMRPQKATEVVTPNGKQFVVGHRGNMPMYAHHRMRHHRRHHHIRRHMSPM